MIDMERRNGQRRSKSWLVTCTNSGTFFLHLSYMVYATILYNPTVPQLILHGFIHYISHHFTTYLWAKADWLGPFALHGKENKAVGIIYCYMCCHVLSFAFICSMLFTSRYLVPGYSRMSHRERCWFNSEESLGAAGPDGHEVRLIQRGVRWHHDRSPWHLGMLETERDRELQSSSKLVIDGHPKLFQSSSKVEFVGILPVPIESIESIESAQEWMPIEEFWRGSILHGSCKRGRRCCALHFGTVDSWSLEWIMMIYN